MVEPLSGRYIPKLFFAISTGHLCGPFSYYVYYVPCETSFGQGAVEMVTPDPLPVAYLRCPLRCRRRSRICSRPNIAAISLFRICLLSLSPSRLAKPPAKLHVAVKALNVEAWYLVAHKLLTIHHRLYLYPPFPVNRNGVSHRKEFDAVAVMEVRNGHISFLALKSKTLSIGGAKYLWLTHLEAALLEDTGFKLALSLLGHCGGIGEVQHL